MAGDWIQMRVSIARDPKVTAMADFLAGERDFMNWLSDPVRRRCDSSAYEHVTRDVTVRVTVSGLLLVWGAANECGKVDGEDLVLHFATLSSLDEIAGIPCFGEAMEFVEWVTEETTGGGKPSIRFPKFMDRNVPSESRKRSSNAERQRRYRDRQRNATSNVTRDVTVTPKEEKRISTPIVPSGSFLRFWGAWPKSTRKQSRGSCWERWRKADFDQVADQIVAHVEALKLSIDWRKDGGAFIPAPLVYLNQRRWEGADASGPEPKRMVI